MLAKQLRNLNNENKSDGNKESINSIKKKNMQNIAYQILCFEKQGIRKILKCKWYIRK